MVGELHRKSRGSRNPVCHTSQEDSDSERLTNVIEKSKSEENMAPTFTSQEAEIATYA